jgi:hypothetical protein
MEQDEARIAELVDAYFRSVMKLDLDLASSVWLARHLLYSSEGSRARLG